jgi:hypothetical protein
VKGTMMKKMNSIVFILFLMVAIRQSAISQVVNDDYKKMNMEEKRLIIAPLLKLDFIDSSFTKAYPTMASPEDSLSRYLNYMLTEKIRKHSQLYRVYGSSYKEEPKFIKRILFFSDSDSIEMYLPSDSTQVRMVLKDQKQTEPDFILFVHIWSIGFGSITAMGGALSDVFSDTDYLGDWLTTGTNTVHDALVFANVDYAYWDNKIGRVAAFNRKHIYYSNLGEELSNPENPFSFNSKIVDLFTRYLLSRTPFANQSMAY